MRPIKSVISILTFGLLACSPNAISTEPTPSKKPNIILIMADDLGAETLGSYGNTAYSTPRLVYRFTKTYPL